MTGLVFGAIRMTARMTPMTKPMTTALKAISKEIPRLALAKCYKALGNEEQAADYEKEAAEIEKGE